MDGDVPMDGALRTPEKGGGVGGGGGGPDDPFGDYPRRPSAGLPTPLRTKDATAALVQHLHELRSLYRHQQEQSRSLKRELALFRGLLARLPGEPSAAPVFFAFSEYAADEMHAEGAILYLVDGAGHRLWSLSEQGAVYVPFGEGLAGAVATLATENASSSPSVHIFEDGADAYDDGTAPELELLASVVPVRSTMLGVIRSEPQEAEQVGDIVAILQVVNKTSQVGSFEEGDEEIFLSLFPAAHAVAGLISAVYAVESVLMAGLGPPPEFHEVEGLRLWLVQDVLRRTVAAADALGGSLLLLDRCDGGTHLHKAESVPGPPAMWEAYGDAEREMGEVVLQSGKSLALNNCVCIPIYSLTATFLGMIVLHEVASPLGAAIAELYAALMATALVAPATQVSSDLAKVQLAGPISEMEIVSAVSRAVSCDRASVRFADSDTALINVIEKEEDVSCHQILRTSILMRREIFSRGCAAIPLFADGGSSWCGLVFAYREGADASFSSLDQASLCNCVASLKPAIALLQGAVRTPSILPSPPPADYFGVLQLVEAVRFSIEPGSHDIKPAISRLAAEISPSIISAQLEIAPSSGSREADLELSSSEDSTGLSHEEPIQVSRIPISSRSGTPLAGALEVHISEESGAGDDVLGKAKVLAALLGLVLDWQAGGDRKELNLAPLCSMLRRRSRRLLAQAYASWVQQVHISDRKMLLLRRIFVSDTRKCLQRAFMLWVGLTQDRQIQGEKADSDQVLIVQRALSAWKLAAMLSVRQRDSCRHIINGTIRRLKVQAIHQWRAHLSALVASSTSLSSAYVGAFAVWRHATHLRIRRKSCLLRVVQRAVQRNVSGAFGKWMVASAAVRGAESVSQSYHKLVCFKILAAWKEFAQLQNRKKVLIRRLCINTFRRHLARSFRVWVVASVVAGGHEYALDSGDIFYAWKEVVALKCRAKMLIVRLWGRMDRRLEAAAYRRWFDATIQLRMADLRESDQNTHGKVLRRATLQRDRLGELVAARSLFRCRVFSAWRLLVRRQRMAKDACRLLVIRKIKRLQAIALGAWARGAAQIWRNDILMGLQSDSDSREQKLRRISIQWENLGDLVAARDPLVSRVFFAWRVEVLHRASAKGLCLSLLNRKTKRLTSLAFGTWWKYAMQMRHESLERESASRGRELRRVSIQCERLGEAKARGLLLSSAFSMWKKQLMRKARATEICHSLLIRRKQRTLSLAFGLWTRSLLLLDQQKMSPVAYEASRKPVELADAALDFTLQACEYRAHQGALSLFRAFRAWQLQSQSRGRRDRLFKSLLLRNSDRLRMCSFLHWRVQSRIMLLRSTHRANQICAQIFARWKATSLLAARRRGACKSIILHQQRCNLASAFSMWSALCQVASVRGVVDLERLTSRAFRCWACSVKRVGSTRFVISRLLHVLERGKISVGFSALALAASDARNAAARRAEVTAKVLRSWKETNSRAKRSKLVLMRILHKRHQSDLRAAYHMWSKQNVAIRHLENLSRQSQSLLLTKSLLTWRSAVSFLQSRRRMLKCLVIQSGRRNASIAFRRWKDQILRMTCFDQSLIERLSDMGEGSSIASRSSFLMLRTQLSDPSDASVPLSDLPLDAFEVATADPAPARAKLRVLLLKSKRCQLRDAYVRWILFSHQSYREVAERKHLDLASHLMVQREKVASLLARSCRFQRLRAIITGWKNHVSQRKACDHLSGCFSRHSEKAAFQIWRSRSQRRLDLLHFGSCLERNVQLRLKRTALYLWKTHCRNHLRLRLALLLASKSLSRPTPGLASAWHRWYGYANQCRARQQALRRVLCRGSRYKLYGALRKLQQAAKARSALGPTVALENRVLLVRIISQWQMLTQARKHDKATLVKAISRGGLRYQRSAKARAWSAWTLGLHSEREQTRAILGRWKDVVRSSRRTKHLTRWMESRGSRTALSMAFKAWGHFCAHSRLGSALLRALIRFSVRSRLAKGFRVWLAAVKLEGVSVGARERPGPGLGGAMKGEVAFQQPSFDGGLLEQLVECLAAPVDFAVAASIPELCALVSEAVASHFKLQSAHLYIVDSARGEARLARSGAAHGLVPARESLGQGMVGVCASSAHPVGRHVFLAGGGGPPTFPGTSPLNSPLSPQASRLGIPVGAPVSSTSTPPGQAILCVPCMVRARAPPPERPLSDERGDEDSAVEVLAVLRVGRDLPCCFSGDDARALSAYCGQIALCLSSLQAHSDDVWRAGEHFRGMMLSVATLTRGPLASAAQRSSCDSRQWQDIAEFVCSEVAPSMQHILNCRKVGLSYYDEGDRNARDKLCTPLAVGPGALLCAEGKPPGFDEVDEAALAILAAVVDLVSSILRAQEVGAPGTPPVGLPAAQQQQQQQHRRGHLTRRASEDEMEDLQHKVQSLRQRLEEAERAFVHGETLRPPGDTARIQDMAGRLRKYRDLSQRMKVTLEDLRRENAVLVAGLASRTEELRRAQASIRRLAKERLAQRAAVQGLEKLERLEAKVLEAKTRV
jgi:hypothetical protein